MRHIFTLVFLLFVLLPMQGFAQDAAIPKVPEPIQNLVNEGAQIRYLGNDYGVEAWLTIKNGQEQYFYVLPGGEAMLMGVLFNNKGELVTLRQVAKIRGQEEELLDALTTNDVESREFKTPAEQMYYDIESANWVVLGQPDAPVVYAFVDPQCGHCHAFVKSMKPEIQAGRMQLRMVPVGFREETQAQAAFLLASPDPQTRWYDHLDGKEDALPAKSSINTQGVQRNLAVMQSWKFDATPMIVYRDKENRVKIVRGTPKDSAVFLADLNG